MKTLIIILLLLAIVAAIFINKIVIKNPKYKLPSQIVLSIIIIFLLYSSFNSILTPIHFNKEVTKRSDAVIKDFKNIRKAQETYKDMYDNYAPNLGMLINFIKHDVITVVAKDGEVSDSLLEAIGNFEDAELYAYNEGWIDRDTILVNVLDSLFGIDFNVDSLELVPFSDGAKYEMKNGAINTKSGVRVKVFQATVTYDVLLEGLDKQLIINLKDKHTHFPGIKVGDTQQPNNNAGNWE